MTGANDLPPGLPRADEEGGEQVGEGVVGTEAIADQVLQSLPTADTEDDLPDYSQEVAELATRSDKFWHNTDPKDFQKNGKVNMLFFDGKEIKIIIFKPGTRTEIKVPVSPQDAVTVKQHLSQLQSAGWDEPIKGTWTDPKKDVDGSTYLFNRTFNIGNGKYLYWRGEHANIGKMVKVSDTLTIESDVEINPGQE